MSFRIVVLAACLSAVSAFAQLKLPALSPEAKVVQTAGLTTITVDYSSPAVKGRKMNFFIESMPIRQESPN